ncbi:MAG: hypothetical protein ABL962_09790 [Fimbriimonadaceae bacterium]
MRNALLLVIALTTLLIGCAPSEPAADGNAATSNPTSTTVAEKAKCDLCGTEGPKAELALHDGKMACKTCIASHNH